MNILTSIIGKACAEFYHDRNYELIDAFMQLLADSTHNGILSATDWISFNSKSDAGHTHSYLPLSGGTLTGDLEIQSTSPYINLYQTDGAVDEKYWRLGVVNGTKMYGTIANDTYTSFTTYLEVTRSGMTVSEVNFPNGTLKSGGTAVSLAGHSHAASDTISGTFDAARIPDLSGTYSITSHNHSGVYEPAFAASDSTKFRRGDGTWSNDLIGTLKCSAPTGRQIAAGLWMDAGQCGNGYGMVGGNAYIDHTGNTFHYTNTHGSIGAVGVVTHYPSYNQLSVISSNTTASTAGVSFTPTVLATFSATGLAVAGTITSGGTAVSLSGHTHAYSSLTDIPSTFAPSSHSHSASDTTSGTFDAARIPDLSGTYSVTSHTHSYLPLSGGTLTGNLEIQSAAPYLNLYQTDGAVDEKYWRLGVVDGVSLKGYLANDTYTAFTEYLTVTRSGMTVSAVNFPNGTLQSGGTAVSLTGHTHSYEPPLGNPDTDGKILDSTAAGVRTWVTKPTSFPGFGGNGDASTASRSNHTHTYTDVGAAAASHSHAASDVTSGTFDVARIPSLSSLYAAAYTSVSAHYFLGSTAGGVPTFQSLAANDIPSLPANQITSGTFDAARIPDLSGTYSLTGHAHSGTYEPVLGNPTTSGDVLASTTGGTRSWAAVSEAGTASTIAKRDSDGGLTAAFIEGVSGTHFALSIPTGADCYISWGGTAYHRFYSNGDVTHAGTVSAAYKTSDGTAGVTSSFAVRNAAGDGTIILNFKNGLFIGIS